MKVGTEINVLAYDAGNNYKGKINGLVSTNGNVTMQGNQLQLEPGTYTFVCLANVDIDTGTNPAYFYALKREKQYVWVGAKENQRGRPGL